MQHYKEFNEAVSTNKQEASCFSVPWSEPSWLAVLSAFSQCPAGTLVDPRPAGSAPFPWWLKHLSVRSLRWNWNRKNKQTSSSFCRRWQRSSRCRCSIKPRVTCSAPLTALHLSSSPSPSWRRAGNRRGRRVHRGPATPRTAGGWLRAPHPAEHTDHKHKSQKRWILHYQYLMS